jgi:transcriptional regulator of acetoin/glycerol metabolism
MIETSKQRSLNYGLSPDTQADYSALSRNQLGHLKEKNQFLYQHAVPIMENLYEQIANTQSVILLTSANGTILHSLGDTDFLEKTAKVALVPGVEWSERSKGTNAIGTALAIGQPVVVHGDQHYLKANQFLTCSCTPIFDPNGIAIGALDVTGDYRSFHHHTMALARMSAQMIENRMFANVFPSEIRIHFHARPEFLGTLVEGIAVFSQDGLFLSANRGAHYQFGLDNRALKEHTFSTLFGTQISQFFSRLKLAQGQPISLELNNGVKVFCHCELLRTPSSFASTDHSAAVVVSSKKESLRHGPFSSLKYLDTGDAQVASVIEKLRVVQNRDIPIMILGETGTGKDLLAQAIHNDSHRADHKFVSVNCASIPESLIESELFGYEEGAFTGAKKKGAMGHIQAANGGTLFLDEIGDMPHHLQARLLRVLQERKVTPLGGGKEVEVDIAIICTTNKNLKQMMAQGEFREDLYYRLNGLVVRLPALRDRQDFEAVTRKIIATLCRKDQSIQASQAVMDLLKRYAWPGNFRQLFNVLRTTLAMAENAKEIEISHLPDDFLEELNCQPPLPQQAVQLTTTEPTITTTQPIQAQMPMRTPDELNLNHVALDAMAQALRNAKGNVSVAARALGVSRNTIYRKKDQLPADVWQ